MISNSIQKRLTSTNLPTKSLMPYMITRINSNIDLLDLLRMYERTSFNSTMRSFVSYYNSHFTYPKRADEVLNEWKGFKFHHERFQQQESSKKINKTSEETP